MLERQHELQVKSFDGDPAILEGEARAASVQMNVTAIVSEMAEMLNEVAWKPWSVDKTYFNRDAYLKECADHFHFWMNLVLGARKPDQTVAELAHEFADLYFGKADVNEKRQESGTYDGRSTKCPDCGRAIEDAPQLVHPDPDNRPRDYRTRYQCPCGRINEMPR